MLVLNRRADEGIIINGNIKVTVRQINGYQVKISIEAPKDINIVRDELDPEHPALEQRFK